MRKINILFVCIHNSARSQMAEAFLRSIYPDKFSVESAGIEPGSLNQLVIAVMKEIGIDISGNSTKSVQEIIDSDRTFDYVITVCDETSAERCPVFPGDVKRLHWGFMDPSSVRGTDEEKIAVVREIRDEIKGVIEEWGGTI